MRKRKCDLGKIWDKIAIGSAVDCWPWIAQAKTDGYGVIQVGGRAGRRLLAHRYIWELIHGEIPLNDSYHGCVIMHNCDNRLCCNPNHLRLGTQSDNVRDMDQKGRRRVSPLLGEAHPNARFCDDDIRFIRASELSNAELGRQMKAHRSVIRSIRQHKTWAHVA